MSFVIQQRGRDFAYDRLYGSEVLGAVHDREAPGLARGELQVSFAHPIEEIPLLDFEAVEVP